MSEAVTTGMTREEKKLVAAVERFQKLEEDRHRKEERKRKGEEEVSKRTEADAPEAAGAARQTRSSGPGAPCARDPPRRGRQAPMGAVPGAEIESAAEQRYNTDAAYRAERDGLVGQAVSKFFDTHVRSYSGTVRHYHCASNTYTVLYEDNDSEVMPHSELLLILAPEAGPGFGADAPGAAGTQGARNDGPAAGVGRKCAPAAPVGGGSTSARKRQGRGEVGAAVKEEDQLSRPGAAEAGAATKKRRILCPHQRRRSQCKECGGAGICPHQRRRSKCKECGGASICPHQRERSTCKECGGAGICPHQRQRSKCKECGGAGICPHQRHRNTCKECGGAGICPHQRRRSECKECGGAGICQHQRRRSRCKECGGASICPHQRIRSRCKECREEADGSMPDGLEEL